MQIFVISHRRRYQDESSHDQQSKQIAILAAFLLRLIANYILLSRWAVLIVVSRPFFTDNVFTALHTLASHPADNAARGKSLPAY